MQQYLELMNRILNHGVEKTDRTGTGTYSLFGEQLRFNLQTGFPLLTTKKLFTKAIIHELLWFLKGDTNIKYLHEHDVHIWDDWCDEKGDLGPIYGVMWRSWPGEFNHLEIDSNGIRKKVYETVDQISWVVNEIRKNPNSRRLIVSAWNPALVDDMALPPCHCLFQFNVANGFLNLQLYQRSADVFLGVPFNIASYALLQHMVAQVTDLKPGTFIHTFGDVHLYKNHIEQAKEQLTRTPKHLPRLILNPNVKNIDDFKFGDIQIVGYDAYPAIKAEVSV